MPAACEWPGGCAKDGIPDDVPDELEAQVNALTAEIEELRSLLRDRSSLFQVYENVKKERDALIAAVDRRASQEGE